MIRTANDLEVEGTYQTKRREVGGTVYATPKTGRIPAFIWDEFASPPAVHKVGTFVKLELDNPNFRHTSYLPTFHVASSITRVVFPFVFSKTDPGPWERFLSKELKAKGKDATQWLKDGELC